MCDGLLQLHAASGATRPSSAGLGAEESVRALYVKVQWSLGPVRVVVARDRARPPGLTVGWAGLGVLAVM